MDTLRLDTLRQRLRERLAAVGLSANEASRRSGLGLSYVNDILCGKATEPKPERLAALAATLVCTPGWLAGDDVHGDVDGGESVMRVARAIEAECRDLPHALKVARMAIAACQARPA